MDQTEKIEIDLDYDSTSQCLEILKKIQVLEAEVVVLSAKFDMFSDEAKDEAEDMA